MWWFISSALDYYGSGPGFESGISTETGDRHEAELQYYAYCNSRGREGNLPVPPKKKIRTEDRN